MAAANDRISWDQRVRSFALCHHPHKFSEHWSHTLSSLRRSSRIIPGSAVDETRKNFTVAALVQANYGKTRDLCIGEVRVGYESMEAAVSQSAEEDRRKDRSVLIVLATDAPLHPIQLQRLTKRAMVGLRKVVEDGHDSSGDILLTFSTANEIPIASRSSKPDPYRLQTLMVEVANDPSTDGLLVAAGEVTEEAIYNVLCMAKTMVGTEGHTIDAMPLDRVRKKVEEQKSIS